MITPQSGKVHFINDSTTTSSSRQPENEVNPTLQQLSEEQRLINHVKHNPSSYGDDFRQGIKQFYINLQQSRQKRNKNSDVDYSSINNNPNIFGIHQDIKSQQQPIIEPFPSMDINKNMNSFQQQIKNNKDFTFPSDSTKFKSIQDLQSLYPQSSNTINNNNDTTRSTSNPPIPTPGNISTKTTKAIFESSSSPQTFNPTIMMKKERVFSSQLLQQPEEENEKEKNISKINYSSSSSSPKSVNTTVNLASTHTSDENVNDYKGKGKEKEIPTSISPLNDEKNGFSTNFEKNINGPIINMEDFGSDSWKVYLYSMMIGSPNPIKFNNNKGIPASIQSLMNHLNGLHDHLDHFYKSTGSTIDTIQALQSRLAKLHNEAKVPAISIMELVPQVIRIAEEFLPPTTSRYAREAFELALRETMRRLQEVDTKMDVNDNLN